MDAFKAGKSIAELFDSFIDKKNQITSSISQLSQDESIPLFDRWCIKLSLSDEVLKPQSYLIPKKSPVGTFVDWEWFNRGQEVSFSVIFDELYVDIKHLSNYESEDVDFIHEQFKELPENLIRQVLKSNYSGFIYDW